MKAKRGEGFWKRDWSSPRIDSLHFCIFGNSICKSDTSSNQTPAQISFKERTQKRGESFGKRDWSSSTRIDSLHFCRATGKKEKGPVPDTFFLLTVVFNFVCLLITWTFWRELNTSPRTTLFLPWWRISTPSNAHTVCHTHIWCVSVRVRCSSFWRWSYGWGRRLQGQRTK